MIPVVIRPAGADDVALVTSSWLESAREEGANRWMDNVAYFSTQRPRMVAILDRVPVVVACNPEDHWHVYGWIAADAGAVHYAYTKLAFRRLGVFDRLYAEVGRPRVATNTGYLFARLHAKYGIRYDPRSGTAVPLHEGSSRG